MVKVLFGGGQGNRDDMDRDENMGEDIGGTRGEKGGRTGGFEKGSDDYMGNVGDMEMPEDTSDETI